MSRTRGHLLIDRDDFQIRLANESCREKSDTLSPYSCKPLAEKVEKPTSFEEIVIDTGKSHGAFYLPRKEWTRPTLDFIDPTATTP